MTCVADAKSTLILCLRMSSTLAPCFFALFMFLVASLSSTLLSALLCVGLYFDEPLYLTLPFCIKMMLSAS